MSAETRFLYEFGRFRCDPQEHLLLCDGKPVSVAPKAFEVLVVLIQSNGRLMTKDDLMQKAWPDTFVEEANLTINISALRKLLGDTPEGQQYIETVPKRGYRFLAPVTRVRDEGEANRPGQTIEVEQAIAVAHAPASPLWSRRRVGVGAGLLLVAITVSVLVSSRSAKLTDKDTVVLADFANSTGDPVFDDALRQGLSSQLEQSPFLNLLSDDRIAQTVSLMAQPKDSRLTHKLAREVCQRTASAAVLDGAIAQVGTTYLLTLKAINCSSGDSLGSAEAQAANKDQVLEALGKLASEIRSQLGESLGSVQKYDAPAENVTTPSLEALKAYSLGYKAMVLRSDYVNAIALFQQAIKQDPNFAMAYARMGTSYADLNETAPAADNARKAFQLKDRVSQRERIYIASHYEIFVTGNLDAARKIFELSAQTYPRDTSFSNLGLIYSELGDYEKALTAFEDAVKINSGIGNWYATLMLGYLQLNRMDDVKAAARKAQEQKMDAPEIHPNLYWVYFLQHNTAGMEREASALMGKPGYEDQMLNYESDTALSEGQLAKARELTRRAIDIAQKAGEQEAAALYRAHGAVREALAHNDDAAKQQAGDALAISHGRDVEALSAIALGMAGDAKQADRLANDLAKRFPEDTLVQFNYLPSIHAAIQVRNGDGEAAVKALVPAGPYELGGNLETVIFVIYPVYFRGLAYLEAKQGAAAAAEFQKILDHPGAVRSEPIGALAHLELGRAFILSGDKVKARNAYQEFLTLWKDADADTPLLKQARVEYAALN